MADILPGGKADKKTDVSFSAKQLRMGRAVEMEHTNRPRLAREIARDHLAEIPDYYTRLKKMEDTAKMHKAAAVLQSVGRVAAGSVDDAILAYLAHRRHEKREAKLQAAPKLAARRMDSNELRDVVYDNLYKGRGIIPSSDKLEAVAKANRAGHKPATQGGANRLLGRELLKNTGPDKLSGPARWHGGLLSLDTLEKAIKARTKLATSLTLKQIRDIIPAPYSEVAATTPLSEVGVTGLLKKIPGEVPLQKQKERLFADALKLLMRKH